VSREILETSATRDLPSLFVFLSGKDQYYYFPQMDRSRRFVCTYHTLLEGQQRGEKERSGSKLESKINISE
jgi:hypothetical protein